MSEIVVAPAKEFGTSKGSIFTTQFKNLSVKVGDDVMYRISPNTKKNENINKIGNMIEEDRYNPLNTTIPMTTNPEDELPDPSCTHIPSMQTVDTIQELCETSTNSLVKFMQDNLPSGLAYYSPELGTAFRTVPPVKECIDNSERYYDLDYKLRSDKLRLEFVKSQLEGMNIADSELMMSSDIIKSVDQCIDVYNTILSTNDEDHSKLVKDVNSQWRSSIRRNTEMGHYVVLKMQHLEDGSRFKYDFEVCFALNTTSLSRYKISMSKVDTARYVFRTVGAYGPLSKSDAIDFRNYIKIAVDLSVSDYGPNSVDEFCTKQFEEFKKNLKKKRKAQDQQE